MTVIVFFKDGHIEVFEDVDFRASDWQDGIRVGVREIRRHEFVKAEVLP